MVSRDHIVDINKMVSTANQAVIVKRVKIKKTES